MAANITPIFPLSPRISWAPAALTLANTAYDGTGVIASVFVAGVNGSRIDSIKVRARGTNTATVMRVFINNGNTNTTATNNVLFMERTIAATTLSSTSETADVSIPMDLSLPSGYAINVTLGTSVAAGLSVACIGGDY